MNGLNPFFPHQDIAIGYGEGQSRTMRGRIYVNLALSGSPPIMR